MLILLPWLLCLLPLSLDSVTHWVIQDDTLFTKDRSEFDLADSGSLVKLLNQEKLVEEASRILDDMTIVKQHIMNETPPIYEETNESDTQTQCYNSGSLSDYDFSILPAIEKTVDGQSRFQQYMCSSSIPSLIPNCTASTPAPVYMGSYHHIPGVHYITEEKGSPSYNLLSFISTDNLALFGHCLNKHIKQNSTNWHVYYAATFYWRLQGNHVAARDCVYKSLFYANNHRSKVDGPLITLANLLSSAGFDGDAAQVMQHTALNPSSVQLKLWSAGNLYTLSGQYKLALEMYNSTLQLGPFPLADERLQTMQCYSKVIQRMEKQNNLLRSTLKRLQEHHVLESQYIGVQEQLVRRLRNPVLPQHIVNQIKSTEEAVFNTQQLVNDQKSIQSSLNPFSSLSSLTKSDVSDELEIEVSMSSEDFKESQQLKYTEVSGDKPTSLQWMRAARLRLEEVTSTIGEQLDHHPDNLHIHMFDEPDDPISVEATVISPDDPPPLSARPLIREIEIPSHPDTHHTVDTNVRHKISQPDSGVMVQKRLEEHNNRLVKQYRGECGTCNSKESFTIQVKAEDVKINVNSEGVNFEFRTSRDASNIDGCNMCQRKECKSSPHEVKKEVKFDPNSKIETDKLKCGSGGRPKCSLEEQRKGKEDRHGADRGEEMSQSNGSAGDTKSTKIRSTGQDKSDSMGHVNSNIPETKSSESGGTATESEMFELYEDKAKWDSLEDGVVIEDESIVVEPKEWKTAEQSFSSEEITKGKLEERSLRNPVVEEILKEENVIEKMRVMRTDYMKNGVMKSGPKEGEEGDKDIPVFSTVTNCKGCPHLKNKMKPPPPLPKLKIKLTYDDDYTLLLTQIPVSTAVDVLKIEKCKDYVPIFTLQEPYFPLMIPLITVGIRVEDVLNLKTMPEHLPLSRPDCTAYMELGVCETCYDHLILGNKSVFYSMKLQEQFAFQEINQPHIAKNKEYLGAMLDYRLRQDPDNWMLYHLAALYHRSTSKRLGPSVECTRRALALAPLHYRTIPLITLVNILHQAQYYPDAMTILIELVQLDPTQFIIHIEASMLHAAISEPNAALYFGMEAVRLEPYSPLTNQLLNSLLCHFNIDQKIEKARSGNREDEINLFKKKKDAPLPGHKTSDKKKRDSLDIEVWRIEHFEGGDVNMTWVDEPNPV